MACQAGNRSGWSATNWPACNRGGCAGRGGVPRSAAIWGVHLTDATNEPMKIQLASDLHLELLAQRFPQMRIIEPVPEADLLVLAGDIHGATSAIDVFGDWPVPVLYVAGNHEFYSERWEATRAAIR